MGSENKFSVDLTTAPKPLADIYQSTFAASVQSGLDPTEADKHSVRTCNLGGWYSTSDGWQKIGPDVRDKVNIRKAEVQPDGRFIVRDLDVFYANDVKLIMGADGKPKTLNFSAADVKEHIAGTNQVIQSGGQKPGLTKGHPGKGEPLPSFGEFLNWRVSPRGEGWARADSVNISPEVIQEWKSGKWTGLSAGIPFENGPKRFTHVALLGSHSQALPNLPQAVVYGADEICFSADPSDYIVPDPATSQRTKTMSKMKLSTVAPIIAAAATAAAASPDPNKVMAALFAQFDGVEFTADQEPKETTYTPPGAKTLPEKSTSPETCVEVPPEGSGAKGDEDKSKEYAAEFAALRMENAKLYEALNGMAAKAATSEFSAYMKDMQQQGYQFDAETNMEMFKAFAGSNNRQGVELLKTNIAKSPKAKGPSHALVGVGAVFGADGSMPLGTKPGEVEGVLKERFSQMGVNYSAEDAKFGEALMGTFSFGDE